MNLLKLGFFAIVFAMTLFATSCGNHDHSEDGHEQHEGHDNDAEETGKTSKEYTSAYICPMHCEGSGSDVEGKCPVCEMDYVANDKHNKEKHEH